MPRIQPKRKANSVIPDNFVVRLLEDIKKLLVLDLASKDIPGKDIAAVLEVDPAVISRILSRRTKKKKIQKQ